MKLNLDKIVVISPYKFERFNGKIIKEHEFGFILKGKWEIIEKGNHLLISPKYKLNETLSEDVYYIGYLCVALGLASPHLKYKQLWFSSTYYSMVNIYLVEYDKDTLVLTIRK
jgi:hypothetical protein